ncbi:MAG: hypothetical protein OHK0029_31740 [Armatimonadaceae bacterium]
MKRPLILLMIGIVASTVAGFILYPAVLGGVVTSDDQATLLRRKGVVRAATKQTGGPEARALEEKNGS